MTPWESAPAAPAARSRRRLCSSGPNPGQGKRWGARSVLLPRGCRRARLRITRGLPWIDAGVIFFFLFVCLVLWLVVGFGWLWLVVGFGWLWVFCCSFFVVVCFGFYVCLGFVLIRQSRLRGQHPKFLHCCLDTVGKEFLELNHGKIHKYINKLKSSFPSKANKCLLFTRYARKLARY